MPFGDPFGGTAAILGSPSVVARGPRDRHAFVVSNTGELGVYTGGDRWNGPGPEVATKFFISPGSIYQPNRDLVHGLVVGQDGGLWDYAYPNGQPDPSPFAIGSSGSPPGYRLAGSPGAVYQSTAERVCIFVATDTQFLALAYVDPPPAGLVWQVQGQGLGVGDMSSPSAVYQSSIDRVCAFVVRTDGNLYLNYFDIVPSNFNWENLQSPPFSTVNPVGAPSAVYQSSIDRVWVFVVGSDGHLWTCYFDHHLNKWVWQDLNQPGQ
jgi:hypothetical protein